MAKKRANGEGNIRKRANGSWEGRYSVVENGQTVRRSVYGKTQAEVRKKLSSVTFDLDNGIYVKPETITVAEWFDAWKTEYLSDVKPSTKEQYGYLGKIHIKPFLGSYKLQKVNAPLIQRFYNESQKPHAITIVENDKKRILNCSGLSAKSVKNLHGVLHKCFAQAVLSGYIKTNPCDSCILPRVEKKEMNVIQGDNITLFLQAIKGDTFENLYFIDLFTGLRQGEIIGLTWDCVDFDKGIIKVEKQLRNDRMQGRGNYTFSSPKNGKFRLIKPAPLVMDALKKERAEQAKNRLKYGFENKDNLVFTNEIGEHVSSRTVYNHVKLILEKIGLGNIRFHDLRHTYATLSIQNGDDIKTVSENLGHATVAFTLDVYSHVTEEMKANSADRMQKFIKAVNS